MSTSKKNGTKPAPKPTPKSATKPAPKPALKTGADLFKESLKKSNEILLKEINSLRTKTFNEPERKFNVLIRTSNRPQYFDKCLLSILNQNYKNYHVYVCYDKIESLSYLGKYNNHPKVTYFPVSVDSKEKYRFNLYMNTLLEKVPNDEWVLFLDDDDKYTHNLIFKTINSKITSDNDLLIWKFMRPDKLIFPPDYKNIKCGQIDTTCFTFNKKNIKSSRWGDKQCGDFYFFDQLVKNHNFNRVFVDLIVTRTIFEDKVASFGN